MLMSPGPMVPRHRVNRRDFLKHAGWGGVATTALVAGRGRAFAQAPASYPDWIPASTKPVKRGGTLARATAWDPPVLDPRLTNSVGLFQIASLVCNRLVRYPFADEANGTADLTLKGDLAESWQNSTDYRVWSFKLRQGVKWHNVPPLNGREFVAADVKYCYEQYAKEGVQAFTFQEIEGIETPDKYTVRIHLKSPNVMFPQNLAEAVTVIFAREVLEEDGDLKKRMIGTGPYVLKENTRKVKAVLARHPDYFDKGRPYVDEYTIFSTPDAATRTAAFRTGQSDILHVSSLADVETIRKTNPAAVVEEFKFLQTPFGLALAQGKPPFNDVRVRRAISMAIDRQRQVDTIYEGHAILGWGIPYIYFQDKAPTAAQLGPYWQYKPAEAQEAHGGGGARQGVRDHAVLLRVLSPDDVADPARPAGSEEEPEHRRQDHQARLHHVFRPLRGRQVGWDGLGLQDRLRGEPGRAGLPVHALQVHQELLPLRRSGDRRADHQAPPDSGSRGAARHHQEDFRARA